MNDRLFLFSDGFAARGEMVNGKQHRRFKPGLDSDRDLCPLARRRRLDPRDKNLIGWDGDRIIGWGGME